MSEEVQPLLHGDGGGGVAPRGLCYPEMELREYTHKYVVRSTDPNSVGYAFSVDRSQGVIQPLQGYSLKSNLFLLSRLDCSLCRNLVRMESEFDSSEQD